MVERRLLVQATSRRADDRAKIHIVRGDASDAGLDVIGIVAGRTAIRGNVARRQTVVVRRRQRHAPADR